MKQGLRLGKVELFWLKGGKFAPDGGLITISAENIAVSNKDNLPLTEGNYGKVSLEDQGRIRIRDRHNFSHLSCGV
jgi:hypothetical protein